MHSSEHQVCRHTANAHTSAIGLTPTSLAICITIYNEPDTALLATLEGLSAALQELPPVPGEAAATISVIVDGVDKCSGSMQSLLKSIGCTRLRHDGAADIAGYRIVCTLAELAQIRVQEQRSVPACDDAWASAALDAHRLGEWAESGLSAPSARAARQVQLVVWVKQKNAGKLDSHWWFYRVLCPAIAPEFCFQTDVGTVSTPHALGACLAEFSRDSAVAAVASNILVASPRQPIGLLENWQYLAFCNTILLEWPAEVACGYLSVVPGQLSALRWTAIAGADAPVGCGPLDVYFKGLGALGPYESMLYLAEDRVLCRELAHAPQHHWTITQADQAMAVTDSCDSWEELLRQRKRWFNGYLACRIHFLGQIPRFLRARRGAGRTLLKTATATAYHATILTYDWLILAFSIAFLYAISHSAFASSGNAIVGRSLLAASAIAFAIQLGICYRGTLGSKRVRILLLCASIQAAAGLGCVLYGAFNGGSASTLALIVSIMLIAPAASLFGHARLTAGIVKNYSFIACLAPSLSLMMWTFAICNVHDNSWGTKGLQHAAALDGPTAEPTARPLAGQSKPNRFRQFRRTYVGAWLTSNLLVAYAAIVLLEKSCSDPAAGVVMLAAIPMTLGLLSRIARGRRNGEVPIPMERTKLAAMHGKPGQGARRPHG